MDLSTVTFCDVSASFGGPGTVRNPRDILTSTGPFHMRLPTIAFASLLATGLAATAIAGLATDADIDAAQKAPLPPIAINGEWNTPYEPFRVIGNVYYVGSAGVSAWLITTPKGHIVIDGIMPQSAPQIIGNIGKLGFDIHDVKILLNSHAHFDHAGGLAGLQRASGARMIASDADKPVLERGDISYGPSAGMQFPPVHVDRTVKDGDTVTLGGVTLTAHMTPGHTQGCTTWTLDVKGDDGKTHNALIHCSATVAGQSLVPESWPGMVAAFRTTFAKVASMKADVFLANHENFFDLHGKRDRQKAGDANAFVNPDELQAFNTKMKAAFEKELADQTAAATTQKPR
jgi:metallo-beta-lactamase class B